MPAPRITIVTPSFNQARYLDQTLRSVVAQRHHVHEYFVLDGGSTDGSAELIRQYAHGIDWWVSEKDQGQADAIQRGLARASGDWLGWINSDDAFLPGSLARLSAAIEAHPEWDVVTAWHVRTNAESRIVSAHRMAPESPAWARWGVLHVTQPTCFFRRSLYEAVGPIRQDLHCVLDTELWFRFFDSGARWGLVRAYVAAFRRHESAKAFAWNQRYQHEFQMMDRQYPQYHGDRLRHRAGRVLHRLAQVGSLRAIRAAADTLRWRGRTVEDVFGPYLTSQGEPVDNP